MLVQRARQPNSSYVSWMVLDDNYLPILPIHQYLRYLENLERSPNTISSYARNLKFFWEFLRDAHWDWQDISLEQLAEFILWLRNPQPATSSLQLQESKRSEKTINHALTTVYSFYEFHERLGTTSRLNAYRYQVQPSRKYKPLLHHISKGKGLKTKILKVKEPSTFAGCLTPDEVRKLIDGCNRLRDKFLLCLLYETGMRIGEALGLRHSDLHAQGVNEIDVVHRMDNFNGAFSKSGERIIHVSKELMRLYSNYLIDEYPEELDSDYVFVNCWGGIEGQPMNRGNVNALFKRLQKKTGVKATPHLLRHTHATELIRAGWEMSYVQKRLGHADVQTTINTYVHLSDEDLKQEYQKYWQHNRKRVNAVPNPTHPAKIANPGNRL